MSSATSQIVAILTSDIHLSLTPPVARSVEPDWFKAMLRQLNELRLVANKYDAPIIYAGDIFHRWDSKPELINFALENLPPGYAIPGQHDLPLHVYEDFHKSAFGTLVQAGHLKLLKPGKPWLVKGWWVYGFPWGSEITCPEPDNGHKTLAVVHAYIWQRNSGFPGAKEENKVGAYRKKLKGYNVALFGDNHKSFLSEDDCTVFNPGSFFRRNIDEIEHKPRLGLLTSKGTVIQHEMDCSRDKFLPKEEIRLKEEEGFNLSSFLKELHDLGDSDINYTDAVRHYMKTYEVSPGAKDVILESLGL